MILMRQYFPILKKRVRAREFNSLFLFDTSRSNSLCRTSFYFDKLNSPDDLTTAQIERISATAPPFRKLWLSGGEPFLRENLAEIVALVGRLTLRTPLRSTSSAWNPRRNGRCLARSAKPPS